MAPAKRTKARERALQALYQIDVASTDLEEALAASGAASSGGARGAGDRRGAGARVAAHRREIDDAIEAVSVNWRLDRMAKVDRNVLRLAVHELLHRPDVPVRWSSTRPSSWGRSSAARARAPS